jgi:hypothetical protein
MATKSSVGWLILAFALAVPGVLFYQWHTRLDLEKKRALTTKVRLKETDLFRNSPKQDKLVNPIVQTPSPVGASAAMSPASDKGPVAAASPVGTAPVLPTPAAAPASVADDPGVQKLSAGPTANAFQSWRDPTLSQHDLVEIARLELEKQIALDELRDRALKGSKPPPKAPAVRIEELIDLQGIVSVEGRNKAIVNNDMVSEGGMVQTKAGPVKVLRISLQRVAFVYKKKTFFKTVSR